MKKICLIGLVGILTMGGRATAAVSGFESVLAPSLGITVDNSFCNQCVTWLTCGADNGYNIMQLVGCDEDATAVTNDYQQQAQEYCRSFAQSAYNVSQVRDLFRDAFRDGAWFYGDFHCIMMDSDYEWARKRELATAIIQRCHQIGACVCGAGKYIQPLGIDFSQWGANSQCLQCPSGGTSNDDGNNVFITACYIPSGGAFSDDTGSGIVNGVCQYSANGDLIDSIH